MIFTRISFGSTTETRSEGSYWKSYMSSFENSGIDREVSPGIKPSMASKISPGDPSDFFSERSD